jgi:hypothetical protein
MTTNFLIFDFAAILTHWRERLDADPGLDEYIAHVTPTDDELQATLDVFSEMLMPDMVMHTPVAILRYLALGMRQEIHPQVAYTAALLAGFNNKALELVAHVRATAMSHEGSTVH